jgi:hypothetical protein
MVRYVPDMIKYVLYSVVVIGFPILMQHVFPVDSEGMAFTLVVFVIIILWALFGLVIFISKSRIPHYAYIITVLALILVMYNIYPWYRNYTGSQIVKDCLDKRKNIDSVKLEWMYTLDRNVENYPLIELAQRRFKQMGPDKSYMLDCYYDNNAGVEQYVMRSVIYFKNGIPFTTDRELKFEQKTPNEYELDHVLDADTIIHLTIKDGRFNLKDAVFTSQIDSTEDIEIYRKQYGKYILHIKKLYESYVFNVSGNYWVYKIL